MNRPDTVGGVAFTLVMGQHSLVLCVAETFLHLSVWYFIAVPVSSSSLRVSYVDVKAGSFGVQMGMAYANEGGNSEDGVGNSVLLA